MPDDFTQGFQYGLNDLPLEPPDDPNTLFSPNGFTSIGMQRAGSAQVIPAQIRVPGPGMQPPGWYPNQGRGLAPGGGPVTEIPMPEAWKTLKTWGPLLPEILRSLHREFIDPASAVLTTASIQWPPWVAGGGSPNVRSSGRMPAISAPRSSLSLSRTWAGLVITQTLKAVPKGM
jgi:hypothetical protein